MNREQILNEIEKTKQQLANMEKMLKECGDRLKPKDNEQYWYITDYGTVNYTLFMSKIQNDNMRFKNYNCFPTREEAEQELEKILIRRQLENIARRLNKGRKIDWNNDRKIDWYNQEQDKYFIRFSYWDDRIQLETCWKHKLQGVIYCLDKKFLDVALKEIGEERLREYLKGE